MNNIAYWRAYYGVSQGQIAIKARVSRAEIAMIEADKRAPNVYIALKIANALKMPVEELFFDDENKKLSLN